MEQQKYSSYRADRKTGEIQTEIESLYDGCYDRNIENLITEAAAHLDFPEKDKVYIAFHTFDSDAAIDDLIEISRQRQGK